MRDGQISISAYKVLSRVAIYMILLGWLLLGLYILVASREEGIIQYFLSREQFGIKFRALILLAPFILTVVGYLISDRAKLFKKTLLAEKELRQKTAELEKLNELLALENIARKKAEEQLTRDAFYSHLTGLPNRSLFMEHLSNALERQKANRETVFGVLLIDIDRFKVINDGLGPRIGDQLLVLFAQRLKKMSGRGDTVAHLGSDEFAVLIEDAKEVWYVESLVHLINDGMRTAFNVLGNEIFLTVSTGIVLNNVRKYENPEELIRDADIALYNAKAMGKGSHVIFDVRMHTETTSLMWLEIELRKALEHNDFTVHYEPVVSLEDNRILGFEALMRWQHPERGLILPSDFFAVAEETGLIVPISYQTIHEACWQVHEWQTQFPAYRDLSLSLNVSGALFFQQDFYEMIENILRETGLLPGNLRLEIPETMLIENPEPAAALIKRFKALNVRFDIDGFGTGYSALNYLRHFPIDGLKIDSCFIKTLPSDKNNLEIVKTIVSLAESMKLDVIASGVETISQLELFKQMNGKYAQGTYFLEPMPGKRIEAFLGAKKNR